MNETEQEIADWLNVTLTPEQRAVMRAEAAEAQLTEARDRAEMVVRNLLTLIDTDDVWRTSAFAKDARAFLSGRRDDT